MIPCPVCDSGLILGFDGVYPGHDQIMYCECQACGKGFDVRVTWEGVELAPVNYFEHGCTCAAFAEDDDCRCPTCPKLAALIAECPHRREETRLYGGLCDACFEEARQVRDCGLRVAEHEEVAR